MFTHSIMVSRETLAVVLGPTCGVSSSSEFTLAACHSEFLSAAKYEVPFDTDSLQSNGNLTATLLFL